MRDTTRSRKLHERAKSYFPGGVTGEGRRALPYPIAIARAKGKEIEDVDGNKYLDYHGGFGTAVLGYSHPEVDRAVAHATSEYGAFVGVPHPYEVDLAERLCTLLDIADRVAFCGGGGSDGIYHAVRIARAATGRTKIVKMEGAYHGWHADVGVSTRNVGNFGGRQSHPLVGVPNSIGSLSAVTDQVIVAGLNESEDLEELFQLHGRDIACLIVEPVAFSLGCVTVEPEFLETCRRLCTGYECVLVFDEVMSGFRSGLAGAGQRLGYEADLAVFGKAIANGYVIAVLAGHEHLMSMLAPEGKVFYSGTFNGHPLSVAAAQATLDVLERDLVPDRIDALGVRLADGINANIRASGITAVCRSWGSVWSLYFNAHEVKSYTDIARSLDEPTREINRRFVRHLQDAGIFVVPRLAIRGFISGAHTEDDIDFTISVVNEFIGTLD